jgi:hypothetical protein
LSLSEQKCLLKLTTEGRETLAAAEFYKACAALANNGETHPEERLLSAPEKVLLDVRRLLNRGSLSQACLNIESLSELGLSPLLLGDRYFLFALAQHRMGKIQAAADSLDRSVEAFRIAGDKHRELRAAINRLICISDTRAVTGGSLFVLEQKAMRENYFDLAAVIQRTRAIELLRSGNLNEALTASRESVHSYGLDGCPEDRLIAICLVAIMEALRGNLTVAQEARNSVFPVDARVAVYVQCYEAVIAGRTPSLPEGHALSVIPWKKVALKPMSVPGKILAALQEKPLTRDQLIEAVWGAGADHPSYRNRLYTAINAVRKTNKVDIYFDGETYRTR